MTIVGSSPARVGGVERVTGRQAYVADIDLEDTLHVKLVTLDVARARIGAIDTIAACDVPGVRLVMTSADLPNPMPRVGPQRRDRPVLAVNETKYHGDPVAAVAADSRAAAEEAARLVRVDLEELPAVHTLAAAEAMTLGVHAGVNPHRVAEVIKQGGGNSTMFTIRAPMMAARAFSPAPGPLHTLVKYLELGAEMAEELGCASPLFSTASAYFRRALADGLGDEDIAAVIKLIEAESKPLAKSTQPST